MVFTEKTVKVAIHHLCERDPVIGQVIARVGSFRLRTRRDRFGSLVRSIVSQQISGAAASTILGRLERAVEPGRIDVDSLSKFDVETFRQLGLSRQKATYVIDLRDKVCNGEVDLKSIGRKSDQEIIDELTTIRGIGVWTAQMFLIFSLGRLDVFPHDDLGIRNAIRLLYELDEMPTKEQSHKIADPWRPYASIAAWYCWRSLEIP